MTQLLRGFQLLQVASLTTSVLPGPGLTAWPLLRHLDLETSMSWFLQHNDLQAFSQLETLRLCSWGTYMRPVNEIPLDLSSLRSLRHLGIENWSPQSLKVANGCQVHAMWQQSETGGDREWLLSPCWRAPSVNMVSLHLERKSVTQPGEMCAIQTILECQTGLELLRIKTNRFGSRRVPITLPTHRCEGQASPLKIEISTRNGCWICLENEGPSRKKLTLKIEGPLNQKFPKFHSRRELNKE